MAHAFHRLFFHFVWRVRAGSSLLEEAARPLMAEEIAAACGERGVEVLACFVMSDHVHLAVRLRPSDAPATFIGQVKGASAFAFNRGREERAQGRAKWQDGYGVVSFRESDLERVVAYVENQHSIHASRRASRLLESCHEPEPEGEPEGELAQAPDHPRA